MPGHQVKSFTEVSLTEAVARRARVDLVLRPVPPRDSPRLVSRFLGFLEPDRLVLDVPRDDRGKVFIPEGWVLGMAFWVEPYLLQAQTRVLDHCQYALYPTRRVDALVVQRPVRIISADRREHPRHEIDPSRCVIASLWPAEQLGLAGGPDAVTGKLLNYSRNGLGVRLKDPLPCDAGTEMVVRLEESGAEQLSILRGTLKYCTRGDDGLYVAGLGDVSEVRPGQAVAWIERLATSQE